MDLKAFYSLSCGLYLVGATHEGKDYGCVVNTVTQVTAEPAKLMVAINKQNATTSAVLASGRFEAAVLCETAPMELIGTFGFQTSRETDKFAPFQTARDAHGVPYVTQDTAAHFSCKVVDTLDAGTHMLIIGLVEDAETLSTGAPMTYAYYHKVKTALRRPKRPAISRRSRRKRAAGAARCAAISTRAKRFPMGSGAPFAASPPACLKSCNRQARRPILYTKIHAAAFKRLPRVLVCVAGCQRVNRRAAWQRGKPFRPGFAAACTE